MRPCGSMTIPLQHRSPCIYGHSCIDLLMLHGITETGDGLAWMDPAIDNDEMEEMLDEL